jgi:hypothetical protein
MILNYLIVNETFEIDFLKSILILGINLSILFFSEGNIKKSLNVINLVMKKINLL